MRTNRFSSSQIPHILWNPKVHYRIHKYLPPVPIRSQMQSVSSHPTSRRSILILSSHLPLDLPSGLFSSNFPTKALSTPLLSTIHATCPTHLILLDLITRTVLGGLHSVTHICFVRNKEADVQSRCRFVTNDFCARRHANFRGKHYDTTCIFPYH